MQAFATVHSHHSQSVGAHLERNGLFVEVFGHSQGVFGAFIESLEAEVKIRAFFDINKIVPALWLLFLFHFHSEIDGVVEGSQRCERGVLGNGVDCLLDNFLHKLRGNGVHGCWVGGSCLES